MSVRNHFIFWAVASLALLGFVYLFKSILLPFVLGIAIAYLLNPFVNALGRLRIGRKAATLIILGGFLICIAIIAALLLPILIRQSQELISNIPQYLDSLKAFIEPHVVKLSTLLGEDSTQGIQTMLTQQSGTAMNVAQSIAGSLARGGQAVFDLFSVIVFMPIVAYFMMVEWDHVTAWVEDLMPREHKHTISDLVQQIDQKVSGFVRGQITVAAILATIYAIALTIAGLKYGFLIGIVSGLLSVIPMVGSAIGLLVSIGVAWFQTGGDWGFVALIGGIFLAGQFFEGNVLSPKIVGESVGMHPLWVFFALLAGGSLFGILGMLLAVPVAAIAGVLLAFAIAQYKLSAIYKGKAKKAKKPAKPKKAKANAK